MFSMIKGILNQELVKTTQGVYKFDLSGVSWPSWPELTSLDSLFYQHKQSESLFCACSPGEHTGVWYIDLKNDAGGVGKGEPPAKPEVVMSMDSADFIKMFKGKTIRFTYGPFGLKAIFWHANRTNSELKPSVNMSFMVASWFHSLLATLAVLDWTIPFRGQCMAGNSSYV